MADSESAQQEQSLLMRLPPELRNRIYGYVLASGDWTVNWRHSCRLYTTPNFLALLQTCRRVHNETMTMPYHGNYIQCDDANTLFDFMTDLRDEKMNAITSVAVKLEYPPCVPDLCEFLKMLHVIRTVKNLRIEASMLPLAHLSNHSTRAILAAIRCLKGLHSLDVVVVDERFDLWLEDYYYPSGPKTTKSKTACEYARQLAKAYKVNGEWRAAIFHAHGSGPV
ncbi:hypothetical protein LTR37_020425 [Vermiconidia calcicola]|uniref:Uncharacterized protein n=1 Tax=Vermiconidia calcicola TaxID=1690605 RepID=A0ACC3MBJ9_9PEZI|nr:hypothetical protein LTR37_020425 [Vermiconidia calcicola]